MIIVTKQKDYISYLNAGKKFLGQELQTYQKKIVILKGTFNLIILGHVRCLKVLHFKKVDKLT